MSQKTKPKKINYVVFVPCQYSEMYHVEAESKEQALQMVKDGKAECVGETSEYYETFKVIDYVERRRK
jgi:hypothetical protein